MICQKSF
jgi:hypothetical protein